MAPPKPTPTDTEPLASQAEAWLLQIEGLHAPTAVELEALRLAALWRALGAAVATPDGAKAPAAFEAAMGLVQEEVDSGPVTEEEVKQALRQAIRRGLGAEDPKVVGAAVALWREHQALAAPPAEVGEEVDWRAEAARARAQAEAMRAAGEVGR
jgi:hypothetical protein